MDKEAYEGWTYSNRIKKERKNPCFFINRLYLFVWSLAVVCRFLKPGMRISNHTQSNVPYCALQPVFPCWVRFLAQSGNNDCVHLPLFTSSCALPPLLGLAFICFSTVYGRRRVLFASYSRFTDIHSAKPILPCFLSPVNPIPVC